MTTICEYMQSLPRRYDSTAPPRSPQDQKPQILGHGGLQVTPILVTGQHAFGAEVNGVDWSRPISGDLVQEACIVRHVLSSYLQSQLVRLQDRYAVLIFRKTGLDNTRHIAFSKQLGDELEVNPFFYGRDKDRIGEPLLWDVGK